jgi:hypothetical protein
VDHIAGERHLRRFVLSFAHDRQPDLRAQWAAHPFHGLIDRQPLYILAIEFDDQVASQDARLGGRGA